MELMRKISEEIVHYEIPEEDMKRIIDSFHQFMKDNGIEWATEEYDGGRSGASFEWTMAKNHFIQSVVQQIEWEFLMSLFDEGEDNEVQSEERDS